MRCVEGVSPFPLGERSGEEAMPPPQKIFSNLDLQMATFGTLWGDKFASFSSLQTPESDSLD